MVQVISPRELLDLIRAGADVIDVRGAAEWDAGHIEGARLVPLEVLRADPDAVLSHDRPLVFVCAKGVRSLAAAKLADRFGYAAIHSLDGGTREWQRAGLALVAHARAAA